MSDAGTPRASTAAMLRRTRGRRRASTMSTAVASSTATARVSATAAGTASAISPTANSAIAAWRWAHRRVVIGVRERSRSRSRPRRRRCSARARLPGRNCNRWRSTAGATATTSSGVTKSRPARRAAAFAAARRCTAPRGLAPSATLGSSRVRRTRATT